MARVWRTIAKRPTGRCECGFCALAGRRSTGAAGFTLIELLVVVAILALLLSILAPSTKYTYQHGQKLACQTHLHQMACAALQFENDHKRLIKIKTSTISFSDEIEPYLGGHDFFFCPTEKARTNVAKNGERLDYGLNHYGRGDPRHGGTAKFYNTMGYYSNATSSNCPNRSTRVANATVIYLADADTGDSPEDIGGVSRGTDEWPIRYSFQRYAYKRHLMGYNYAALDASTGWYPADPPTNEKWFIRKY